MSMQRLNKILRKIVICLLLANAGFCFYVTPKVAEENGPAALAYGILGFVFTFAALRELEKRHQD